ncbi:hypothetical protein [Aphanothece hegewaldii]|uniref:hypothetical protein n=1 Tax=Aphanothece hegewaldii TaxID=1521625 RepID=UPI00269AB559
MIKPRPPAPTVKFIDTYCKLYQDLFVEVRAYECFKYLHAGRVLTFTKSQALRRAHFQRLVHKPKNLYNALCDPILVAQTYITSVLDKESNQGKGGS